MSLQRRTTLTKYLIEQQRENNNLPADLRLLIEVVARACKAISYHVSKGALGEALGTAGSENVQMSATRALCSPRLARAMRMATSSTPAENSGRRNSVRRAITRRRSRGESTYAASNAMPRNPGREFLARRVNSASALRAPAWRATSSAHTGM